MNVGFTGTRRGMSESQKERLRYHLDKLSRGDYQKYSTHYVFRFHHGDCVGADAEAHEIASDLGWNIYIHPPLNEKARAFCKSSEIYPAKTYITRNHDIVDDADLVIAAPATKMEQLRSGTWATVRYAQKRGKPVLLITP